MFLHNRGLRGMALLMAGSLFFDHGVEGESRVNQVQLSGRLAAVAEERTLPSGDRLWTFRVVVPREEPRGRQTVDTLDCSVWSQRVGRSVSRWEAGDIVEVSGPLRRRFFRTGGGSTASRVEIEVHRARRVRRPARPVGA